MPLDKVTYLKLQDGSIQKTVTHVEIVQNVPNEAAALQAQAANFAIGRSSDPATQADIDATIQNVTDGLNVLTKP